jgi:hypothetical protein
VVLRPAVPQAASRTTSRAALHALPGGTRPAPGQTQQLKEATSVQHHVQGLHTARHVAKTQRPTAAPPTPPPTHPHPTPHIQTGSSKSTSYIASLASSLQSAPKNMCVNSHGSQIERILTAQMLARKSTMAWSRIVPTQKDKPTSRHHKQASPRAVSWGPPGARHAACCALPSAPLQHAKNTQNTPGHHLPSIPSTKTARQHVHCPPPKQWYMLYTPAARGGCHQEAGPAASWQASRPGQASSVAILKRPPTCRGPRGSSLSPEGAAACAAAGLLLGSSTGVPLALP